MIQQLVNINDQDLKSLEPVVSHTHSKVMMLKKVTKMTMKKKHLSGQRAVMIFLELYREREHEFTTGRHNKL